MTQKDKDRLLSNWKQETNDPEIQKWRENLTEEEQSYVDTLDDQYTGGRAASRTPSWSMSIWAGPMASS